MRASGLGARRRAALIAACVLGGVSAVGGLATVAHAGPYPGAPDPGGDPNAVVPVPPPPGKFFGYHEESVDGPHGWNAAQLAQVAKGGGANVLRFSLGWWNVEPSRDHWDENWWARYGRLYDALIANGIQPLITLGDVPPWARSPIYALCGKRRGCEYPPGPGMDAEWAEFAAEVARRFPQTAAIEIWNEPNLVGFWKPAPDPYRFAQLVAAAYPSIKDVNPDIRVLAGGFAPAQSRGLDFLGQLQYVPMKDFLNTAYSAAPSIKGRMDGISFHTVFNHLDYGAESLFAKVFADARTTAANHGDAGIPLWLSETGLTTTGPEGLSHANQASGLLAQYRRLMTMPDVEAMVVHTLADQVQFAPSDLNHGYGLISSFSPLTTKPAFCAFAGRVATPSPYGGCPTIVDTDPGGDPGGGDPGGPGGGSGAGGTGGGSPSLSDILDDLLGGLSGR